MFTFEFQYISTDSQHIGIVPKNSTPSRTFAVTNAVEYKTVHEACAAADGVAVFDCYLVLKLFAIINKDYNQ